ncbi:cupin domain-containing protein [Patescibacteria group bacterium]|nr:cupin domain-containing protein [Patescibacteria group bacterium]
MKKFSIKNLEFIPAGHEDPQNPGVLKKVIFNVDELRIEGVVQMINWAKMEAGKSFARHYHEYMDEIFIVLSGKAEINIDKENSILDATDTVYIPQGAEHEMKNISADALEYIAIGIVSQPGGKTIVVDKSE